MQVAHEVHKELQCLAVLRGVCYRVIEQPMSVVAHCSVHTRATHTAVLAVSRLDVLAVEVRSVDEVQAVAPRVVG